MQEEKGRQNTASLFPLEDVQVTCLADPADYWDLKDFYYKSKAGRGPVKEMIEAHYREKTPNYKVTEYTGLPGDARKGKRARRRYMLHSRQYARLRVDSGHARR